MNCLIKDIKKRFLKKRQNCFSKAKPELSEIKDYIPAAVMLILNMARPEPSLLFIKRPQRKEDVFSGHVAFPGGKKVESDKDLRETALRETFEEVGIDIRKCGSIVGMLGPVVPRNTSSDKIIVVTPFISLVERDVTPKINTHEVQEYSWIPVSHLADERNMRVRRRYRDGKYVEDFVYNYGTYLIWGMTGRIVRDFLLEFGDLFI